MLNIHPAHKPVRILSNMLKRKESQTDQAALITLKENTDSLLSLEINSKKIGCVSL